MNGDTAAIMNGSLTRAAGETVAGGPYAISQGTVSGGSNYTISYTGANLTINPATLAVTAAAQSKTYGAADPALTYSVSGLVNGDTDTVMSGSLTRTAGETVAGGPYAISQGTVSANSNYTISYTGANLTINPQPFDNAPVVNNIIMQGIGAGTASTSTGSTARLEVVREGVNVAPSVSTPQSNTASPTTAAGTGLQLQTGTNVANITMTEVGSTLTITAPGLAQGESVQQNVAVFVAGGTSSNLVGVYSVNSGQGAIAITPTATTVSTVAANPSGNASGLTSTFSMSNANGGMAEFIVKYAEGAISIQPVNQIAISLMSEAGSNLITAAGMITAQTEMGITMGQVQAVYLEQTVN